MRGRRGDRGQSAAKRATLGLVTAIAPETGRLTLLDPASPLAGLLNAPIRTGTVTWIGLRPERRQPLLAVANAELDPVDGLLGDHYRGRTNNARQVTLMQAEHLAAIATYLGIGPIEPDRLRRNIVVSGVNLLALQGRRFRLGSAVLIATGLCHPCSRMEALLGVGGYSVVRGHGGITARVLDGGRVSLGDPIARADDDNTIAPPSTPSSRAR